MNASRCHRSFKWCFDVDRVAKSEMKQTGKSSTGIWDRAFFCWFGLFHDPWGGIQSPFTFTWCTDPDKNYPFSFSIFIFFILPNSEVLCAHQYGPSVPSLHPTCPTPSSHSPTQLLCNASTCLSGNYCATLTWIKAMRDQQRWRRWKIKKRSDGKCVSFERRSTSQAHWTFTFSQIELKGKKTRIEKSKRLVVAIDV